MASLKEIMNLDEESLGTEPLKRDDVSSPQTSRPRESSSTASSYASPIDQPFAHSSAAHSLRHSPSSSQTSRFLTTETHSSSSPGASTSTSRRRSNTSTDSMDTSLYGQPQAYGHGYGHPFGQGYPSSSSGGPPRPHYGQPSGSNEAPVKLTPVTGKPSRARKGLSVHVCDECQPPKTFTRAEHLRRHKLSHQPPELVCPVVGCDKSFHRKDLLERHQLRHEQDSPTRPPIKGEHPGSGPRYDPEFGESPGSQPTSSYTPSPSVNSSLQAPNPPGLNPWPSVVGSDASTYPKDFDVLQSSPGIGPYIGQQRTHDDMHTMYISDASNSWSETSHRSRDGWMQGVSPYTAVPREMQNSVMNPFYATSPPQMGGLSSYGGSIGIPVSGYPEESALCGQGLSSNTVGSLPQPLAVTQSSETIVIAPAEVSPDRLIPPLACSRQPGEAVGLLAAHESMPVSLSCAARSAIPAYLEVFWDKVNHGYPVIHRPTFEETSKGAPEQIELLRCAMAAVATQFLEDKDHRINGNVLHAHAWYASKILTQADIWSLPVMQTVLLCEYYARFRGRKKESHRPSSRLALLYQMLIDNQHTFSPLPTSDDSSQSWKEWVQMESCRRLLSACFLLDVHTTCYFEQSPLPILNLDYSDHSSLHIPLSATTTQMWEAPNAQAWNNFVGSAEAVKTVSMISPESLVSDDIAYAPPFDASILLAASALRLPRRQDPHRVIVAEEDFLTLQNEVHRLANVFLTSGTANAYLALQLTPLHTLLSVSGDSWLFNRKLPQASSFEGHKQHLGAWCKSPAAALAASFAARALVDFLNLRSPRMQDARMAADVGRGVSWNDISDYWGVYVCALVCWAFGQGAQADERSLDTGEASRQVALDWILRASEMEPEQLSNWPQRRSTRAVVCLARDLLSRDCLGGRNILFADAVCVLKKLGNGDRLKRF